MKGIKPGDLIRWKSDLFIVESGVEKEYDEWHYALIIEITLYSSELTLPFSGDILLQPVGPARRWEKMLIPIEVLRSKNKVQRSDKRGWVNVVSA